MDAILNEVEKDVSSSGYKLTAFYLLLEYWSYQPSFSYYSNYDLIIVILLLSLI